MWKNGWPLLAENATFSSGLKSCSDIGFETAAAADGGGVPGPASSAFGGPFAGRQRR